MLQFWQSLPPQYKDVVFDYEFSDGRPKPTGITATPIVSSDGSTRPKTLFGRHVTHNPFLASAGNTGDLASAPAQPLMHSTAFSVPPSSHAAATPVTSTSAAGPTAAMRLTATIPLPSP